MLSYPILRSFLASGTTLTMAAAAAAGPILEAARHPVTERNASSESVAPAALRQTALDPYDVRLQAGGRLVGRISIPGSVALPAEENLTVVLIRDGSQVGTYRLPEGGIFTATGLTPGVYSLIARGKTTFFACGIKALPASGDSVSDVPQITSTAIQIPNVSKLRELIQSHISPKDLAKSTPQRQAEKSAPTASLASMQDQGDLWTGTDSDITSRSGALTEKGQFEGRLSILDPKTGERLPITRLTAFLVANGNIVAETPVAADGQFSFPKADAGRYAFIAVGPQGLGAFSLDILPFEGASAAKSSGEVSVKLASATKATGFTATLIGPDALQFLFAASQNNNQGPLGAFGGAAGFGGGAGGGGLGGGGLLGPLLGLTGVGLGAAALANDNDNNKSNSP